MWSLRSYLGNIYLNLDDLVLSIFVIVVTVYICDFFRELVLFGGRFQLDAFYRYPVAEIIGTVEATVIAFEINFIIYDILGLVIYTLGMWISLTWQALRPPDYQFEANPLNVIIKHLEAVGVIEHHYRHRKRNSFEENQERSLYERFEFIVVMIWAQGIGAYIGYNLTIYAAWSNAHYWPFLKGTNYHVKRYSTLNQWTSSMEFGPIHAAIVEGFFSCTSYLWPMYINFRRLTGKPAVIFKELGRAIFSGIGAVYSGGYYNPVVGTALEITTLGYSGLIIVLVYWVAPIIGTLMGFLLGEIS